jgi:hypothetical protein
LLFLLVCWRIADSMSRWKPNEKFFATRNATTWDANLLVKRKLYPLLDSLGIERGVACLPPHQQHAHGSLGRTAEPEAELLPTSRELIDGPH